MSQIIGLMLGSAGAIWVIFFRKKQNMTNLKKISYSLLLGVAFIGISYSIGMNIGIINPSIPRHLTEWQMFYPNNDSNSESKKLVVLEDGYKLIQVGIQKKIKNTRDMPVGSKVVEWGWIMKIMNKDDETVSINIQYELLDADKFTLTLDYASHVNINPGETKIIRRTSTFDYNNLKRLKGRTWSISYN